MENYIKNMPKIELHAHLNGSLTKDVLLELGAMKYGENDENFKELCKTFTDFAENDLVECFKKFKIAHDVVSTKANLKRATICAIRDFALDNVIYLELRTTPKNYESMSKHDYLKCVLEGIWQAEIQYPHIKVKLLPSIDRSQDVNSAKETLEIVLKLMKDYPGVIKGIDFCGDPTKNSFSMFKEVLKEAIKNSLELTIHCGEVENDKEVEEMLNFASFRCGHATHIKDKNLELLLQNKIPVECCLTSNVKCGTVSSYEDHHFANFLQNNHPVVICTDDFGIFETSLSKEFLIAHRTYNLQKKDLMTLTTNAIDCSFASDKEKNDLTNVASEYFENAKI